MESKITAKEQIKEIIKSSIRKHLSSKHLILEGGESTAMIDPKTPKIFNGAPAKPTQKLVVGSDGDKVAKDIMDLALALNSKLKFWSSDNPYLHSGYMFNGSSQYLMNPKTRNRAIAVKPEYGDIDIIIPKDKLSNLDNYLDSGLDDYTENWSPTDKNKVSDSWHYVGRPRSYAKIPDQTVTLWYYVPKKQIVQVDFEGDDMVKTKEGYEKPSDWIKFSKSAPLTDAEKKIKGLAHKVMLRALTRAVYYLGPVAVVGKTRKPSTAAKHRLPSKYTLNTGGGEGGMRQAYKPSGEVEVDGKKTPAYEYIEAKMAKAEFGSGVYITELPRIFKMLFGADPVITPEYGLLEQPEGSDLKKFESFTGLVELIREAHEAGRMKTETIKRIVVYFKQIIEDQGPPEMTQIPVKYLVKNLKSILKQ